MFRSPGLKAACKAGHLKANPEEKFLLAALSLQKTGFYLHFSFCVNPLSFKWENFVRCKKGFSQRIFSENYKEGLNLDYKKMLSMFLKFSLY